jgi:hypothetical protein
MENFDRVNRALEVLRAEDIDEYKNYMRMSKETFNMLLEKVRPYIMRSFTNSFVQLHFDILVELVCVIAGDRYKNVAGLSPVYTIEVFHQKLCQSFLTM